MTTFPDGCESQVVTTTEDFAALRDSWDELHQHASSATAQQSWGWLYSWWQHYGGDASLRVVVLRVDGQVVAVLPLMEESRARVRRLSLLGTGVSDYLDCVVRDGFAERVAALTTQVLSELGGWHVLDLHRVREGTATEALVRAWTGPRLGQPQAVCRLAEARPVEETVAGLSRASRKDARRTLARAEEEGLSWRRVEPLDVPAGVDTWLDLHRRLWAERGINPEHATTRFASFLRVAVPRMGADGTAQLHQLVRDDRVEAAALLLPGRASLLAYLIGTSAWLDKGFTTAVLFTQLERAIAIELGLPHVSVGRGDEPYKLRWTTEVEPATRYICSRTLPAWTAYVGCTRVRPRLGAAVRANPLGARVVPLVRRGRQVLATARSR